MKKHNLPIGQGWCEKHRHIYHVSSGSENECRYCRLEYGLKEIKKAIENLVVSDFNKIKIWLKDLKQKLGIRT